MQPIRILHCVVSLGHGGAETLIMNLYRNINRSNVQFDFLTSLDGDYEEEIAALGGRIYKIPFISQVGPFVYAKNLREFFKAHPEYTIVHSHMDKFSGMLMKQAAKMKVPIRIAHSHNIKNDGGFLYQIVKEHYGRQVLPYATHYFACSKAAAQWMFSKKAAQATVLKNGIDTNYFHCADRRDKTIFTMGSIARFSTQKNHTFLVDIFAELRKIDPTARLVLVGDGDLQHSIKNKVDQLGLTQQVQFLGVRTDIVDLLSSFDVFVMPSLFEGLGIVLIEAQAVGVPCVASTTIPREADITGEISFLSLRDSAAKWAVEISQKKGMERCNYDGAIEKAGYDIKESAQILETFYRNAGESG